MKIQLTGGGEYEVARQLTPLRAFIDYGGVYVLVDRDPIEGWALSGDPATPGEMVVLEELTAAMEDQTITAVTKDV